MKKHRLTGEGGKGSARRNSNEQAYRDNWDEIFGKTQANVTDRSPSEEQINLGLHINEQTHNKTK